MPFASVVGHWPENTLTLLVFQSNSRLWSPSVRCFLPASCNLNGCASGERRRVDQNQQSMMHRLTSSFEWPIGFACLSAADAVEGRSRGMGRALSPRHNFKRKRLRHGAFSMSRSERGVRPAHVPLCAPADIFEYWPSSGVAPHYRPTLVAPQR